MLAKLLAATVATGLGSFAIVSSLPPETESPRFEVRATVCDPHGRNCQLFIAGSGDDCPSAWQGANVPKGWQSIECVDATAPRFAFHF